MGEMPVGRMVDWNKEAEMYSEFAFCELDDTRLYLEVLGVGEGDTVLDVCCGPGRVSVAAAERGARVVGIDSAEKMLEHARRNAEGMGVGDRCDFRLLDWNHVLVGQNLERADVVIASRCGAMMDVEKLSSLAKRTVAVQIFANAPSIPLLLEVLFSGYGEAAGPEMRPDGEKARKAIYLKIAEKAFDAGYDPNVRVFPERFRKWFASADKAVEWVASMKPGRAAGGLERLALNVAPFLRERDSGVEFCIATKAAIIWWDVA